MKTTFAKIKSFKPCVDSWKKLCKNLNPEMDMDKEISMMEILASNGIKDAVWALRTQEYRDYCLFLADVAESVLHIFEKQYPDDNLAIEAIRKWYAGEISDAELRCAAVAAYAVASVAYDAAANTSADAAVYSAVYSADASDAATDRQWEKIEKLFLKHFGEENKEVVK